VRSVTRGLKRRAPAPERLPQSPPDELMRMLIPPSQALALLTEGKTAEALANATRQIGAMTREGLGHLACSDILTALAELDLRARQLAPSAIASIGATDRAITEARAALVAAEAAHARAKAEVLLALGYREQAEALGFRVGIVEEPRA
jgi:hypothetical protein